MFNFRKQISDVAVEIFETLIEERLEAFKNKELHMTKIGHSVYSTAYEGYWKDEIEQLKEDNLNLFEKIHSLRFQIENPKGRFTQSYEASFRYDDINYEYFHNECIQTVEVNRDMQVCFIQNIVYFKSRNGEFFILDMDGNKLIKINEFEDKKFKKIKVEYK